MSSNPEPLDYFRGDELAPWEGTVTINGVQPDFSSGWTFTVTVASASGATAPANLTTGITGDTGGAFTVAWPKGYLNIAEGWWDGQITFRRTADGFEHTEAQPIRIKARVLAET